MEGGRKEILHPFRDAGGPEFRNVRSSTYLKSRREDFRRSELKNFLRNLKRSDQIMEFVVKCSAFWRITHLSSVSESAAKMGSGG